LAKLPAERNKAKEHRFAEVYQAYERGMREIQEIFEMKVKKKEMQ